MDAEKWLNARVTGLSPADFPDGLAIYTTLPMQVPTEFRSVSRATFPRHSTGNTFPESVSNINTCLDV